MPESVCRWTRAAGSATSRGTAIEASFTTLFLPQQALRTHGQNNQENEVSRENAEARIDAKSNGLTDAEHHGSEKRAPDRAHASDDHCLEGVDQLERAIRRGHCCP